MSEPTGTTAREHFERALELGPGAKREHYLEGIEERALRRRVQRLLSAHEGASGSFLEGPLIQLPPEPEAGDLVGAYRLESRLGEGGFAVVWRAKRQDEIGLAVALKVLKPGMDSRAVLGRFEAERAALARLDHPAIARIHEAGSTEQGRPFFAMELVDGPPITLFADRERLDLQTRLRLFLRACRAIQYAHSKGLVHRDLKPGNVLVESRDEIGTPKVIDFGVAKAVEGRLVERLELTTLGELVGTPAYMAPEQAAGDADVDTRADIYSMGALLHELLVGAPPHEPQQFRTASRANIERTLAEIEPASPSGAALELVPERAAEVAEARGLGPTELPAVLRGDLDWIVGRALEKDPARRYPTIEALARDIERHLANEPVEAGPPSTLYRVRKFLRRNRPMVFASALGALALLIGLALAFVERDRAREEARLNALTKSFLQTLFAPLVGAEALPAEEVARQVRELFGDDHSAVIAVLREYAGRLAVSAEPELAVPLYREALGQASRSPTEPAEVAALHGALGSTLIQLGRETEAQPELERCAAIAAPLAGPLPVPVAEALAALARLAETLGDAGRASELYATALHRLHETAPAALRIRAAWLARRADALANHGALAESAETRLAALDAEQRSLPAGSLAAARAQLQAAEWLDDWNHVQLARPAASTAISLARVHQREYPRVLFDAYELGRRLEADHDPVEADRILDDQVALARQWLPEASIVRAQIFIELAESLETRGRTADSLEAWADVLRGLQLAERRDLQLPGLTEQLLQHLRRAAVQQNLSRDAYQAARLLAEVVLEGRTGQGRCVAFAWARATPTRRVQGRGRAPRACRATAGQGAHPRRRVHARVHRDALLGGWSSCRGAGLTAPSGESPAHERRRQYDARPGWTKPAP